MKHHLKYQINLQSSEISQGFDLNKTLIALGIKDAFTSAADFSGITEKENLYKKVIIQ